MLYFSVIFVAKEIVQFYVAAIMSEKRRLTERALLQTRMLGSHARRSAAQQSGCNGEAADVGCGRGGGWGARGARGGAMMK